MFKVEKEPSGEIVGVRRKLDGSSENESELIKENYDDQSFCDFLTWASRQDKNWRPDFILNNDRCRFFASKKNLIDYCKRNGVMLWTRSTSDGLKCLDTYEGITPCDKRLPPLHPDKVDNAFLKFRIAIPQMEHIKTAAGIDGYNAAICLTWREITELNKELIDENSDARKVSNIPIVRSFVYFDISDFSKFPPGVQAIVIKSLLRIVHHDHLWHGSFAGDGKRSLESMICIGDGYIFVFQEPDAAAIFASCLAYYIERLIAQHSIETIPVEFHFRIGIHAGPVYCFWDPGRNGWNYIGDGINGGQRVLTAAGKEKDDVIYVSGDFRKLLHQWHFNSGHHLPVIRQSMHNRGRHADKHGNYWRLYELNHDDLVSKFMGNIVISLP